MCLIFYSELMDHVFALYVNKKVLGHVFLFTVVALLSYVKFLQKSCAVRSCFVGTPNLPCSYSSVVCSAGVHCIYN